MLSLKELCERVGVTRRGIQGYEKAGLLKPTDKNKYGHLLYDEVAVRRAEKIKFMQKIGFTLRETKGIIDASDEVLKEALLERVCYLEREKIKLDSLIEELNALLERL